MRFKRFIPALIVAFVLSGAALSRAQTPVTDVLALAEHIAEVALQGTIRVVRQTQAELVYKMSLRLSIWTSLERYLIDRDDMPEFRIHCWFDGCGNLFANDYLSALTYGDANGTGYTKAVLPRQNPADVLAGLTSNASASVRSDLALIDLSDSAIIRGTHETGRLRYNGRAESEAIIAMQEDVTDEDNEQSLAALLDKVSAISLVQVQNRQARGQFQAAILEQLIVDQAWDRNADAAHMNMILRHLAAISGDEDAPPSIVRDATNALQNWRLP